MGIVNYTYNRSTSGGEIITHLINSTDGQGLDFANGALLQLDYAAGGVFGTGDFSIEFIIDQSSANSNNKIFYTSQGSGSNVLQLTSQTASTNIEISFDSTDYDLPYDMSADYGSPVHYVLTFDRSALATLYKDGNSVATISISGSSGVDLGSGNTNVGYLGGASDYGVTGVFYRWRTWKKLLSAAEVTACYENASVPITDQWSNCVTDLDFAFANPERSLSVRSRSGAGNATAAAGIFQVTPIEQLNSKAARIGTSAATPADGELLLDTFTASSASDTRCKINTSGTGSNAGLILNNSGDGNNSWMIRRHGAGNFQILHSTGEYPAGTATVPFVIDSAGNVGIGAAPGAQLDSYHATLSEAQISANTGNDASLALIERVQATSPTAKFGQTNAYGFQFIYDGGTNELLINSGAEETVTTRLKIDRTTGLATFSNGIAFSSQTDTTTGTTTATTLDHYEEGTWTATDASSAGLTFLDSDFSYTRIGDRVFVTGKCSYPSTADATAAEIEGLPFNVSNDNNARGLTVSWTDASTLAYCLSKDATDGIKFTDSSGNSVTNATLSLKTIYISGVYRV